MKQQINLFLRGCIVIHVKRHYWLKDAPISPTPPPNEALHHLLIAELLEEAALCWMLLARDFAGCW